MGNDGDLAYSRDYKFLDSLEQGATGSHFSMVRNPVLRRGEILLGVRLYRAVYKSINEKGSAPMTKIQPFWDLRMGSRLAMDLEGQRFRPFLRHSEGLKGGTKRWVLSLPLRKFEVYPKMSAEVSHGDFRGFLYEAPVKSIL